MSEIHEFYFLRHGETEGNLGGWLQGQTDTPLTDRGRQQTRWLAYRWAQKGVRFDRILASPQERARQTAEIIAQVIPAPLEFDPLWMERDFGVLEGESFETIRQRQPPVDYFHPFASFEGSGETQTDLYMRALRGLQGLAQRPPGCYLIVSHGALLGRICFAIFGVTPVGNHGSLVFRFENTAYLRVLYEHALKRWQILGITNPAELADSHSEET